MPPTEQTETTDFSAAFDKIATSTPAETPEETPKPAPAQDEPAETPEPGTEAEGDEEAPEGEAEEGTEEEGEEAEGEGEPEKPADGAEPAEGEDEKPPEGISPRAQTRFGELLTERKALKETNKTLTAENEQLKGQFTELTNWVRETQATPEEFQQQVDRLRVFKTGKPDELQKLRTELLEAARDITVRLGDDMPGFDPLSDYPDLQKEVEELKLTPERAKEIAMSRRQKARGERTTKETEAQQRERQKHEAHAAAVTKATTAIKQLEATWLKSDPDAKRKIAVIMENIEDFKFLPPERWAPTVEKRYKALGTLAPQRTGQTPRPASGTHQKPGAQAEPSNLGALMDSMTVR